MGLCYNGHLGVELISKLLGTEERAGVLGRENRMNQQVRAGLAHRYITRQHGVTLIQKRPPFQGESGTAGYPGLKHLGYSVAPLRGEESSDGVAMLTRTGGCRMERSGTPGIGQPLRPLEMEPDTTHLPLLQSVTDFCLSPGVPLRSICANLSAK